MLASVGKGALLRRPLPSPLSRCPPAARSASHNHPLAHASLHAPKLPLRSLRAARAIVRAAPQDLSYAQSDPADALEAQIWGFLAVSALCGTVTGSIMFLKTGNPKWVWVSAGLPVMALLSGAMRERAKQEASRDQMVMVVAELRRELGLLRSDTASASSRAAADPQLMSDMRELVRYVDASRGLMQRFEGRVSGLETSAAAASRAAQDAAAAALRVRQDAQGSVEGAIASLRREVGQAMAQGGQGGVGDAAAAGALGRLDAKLASLEAAISSLESSQADSFRRFSSSFAAAMSEASGQLQGAVRSEVVRSLEPVRDAYTLAPGSTSGTAALAAPWAAPGRGGEGEAELTDRERARLREVVRDEVQKGVGQVLSEQEAALGELAARPVALGADQWTALGSRLRGIERVLTQLPEEQRRVLDTWGQSTAMEDTIKALREATEALRAREGAAGDAGDAEEAAGAARDLVVIKGLEEVTARLAELKSATESRDRLLEAVLKELSNRIASGEGAGAGAGARGGQQNQGGQRGLPEASSSTAFDSFVGQDRAAPPSDAGASWVSDIVTDRAAPEPVPAGRPASPRAATAAQVPQAPQPPPAPMASASVSTAAAPAPAPAAAPEPVPESPATPTVEAVATPTPPPSAAPTAPTPAPPPLPRPTPAGGGPVSGPAAAALANPAAILPLMAAAAANAPPPLPSNGKVFNFNLPRDPVLLLRRGLDVLRSGRDLARTGADNATAEVQITEARACFEAIIEYDPQNIPALGNLGNALLALGQLKAQETDAYLAANPQPAPPLPSSIPEPPPAEPAPPGTPPAWYDPVLYRMEEEAHMYLVTAGRRFRQAYEANVRETRALCNWGQALCLRAKITARTDLDRAARLYEAALEKYRAVIGDDGAATPAALPALRFTALALRDYSSLPVVPAFERAELLEAAVEAANRAVEAAPPGEPATEALEKLRDELDSKLDEALLTYKR